VSEPLRRTIVHRSLHRPNLLMGGERELVLTALIFAAMLIVVALNWVAFLAGLTVYSVALYGLRLMAEADPMMSKVYQRHLRYVEYYPAHSTPFRVE